MAKRKAPQSFSSAKKIKVQYDSLDVLPWKHVARPVDTGLDGDDGILTLEEIDNVEVVYETGEDGAGVVQFNVLQVDADTEVDATETSHVVELAALPATTSFDAALLPSWGTFNLHPHLLHVLYHKSFTTPTPIQSQALPHALSGRDVIGVAETGSGKTLAYGLPILHDILSRPRSQKSTLHTLILLPTRELALQVSDHLRAFSASEPAIKQEPKESKGVDVVTVATQDRKQQGNGRAVPLVGIAVLVGGMSAQKQRRILDRGVDILIATPGRLWDTLEEDEVLAQQVRNVKVLVLDEADRMIEAGHFAEMENILRLTVRVSTTDTIEPGLAGQEREPGAPRDDLQTLVFSATLSKDLQRNLKRRSKPTVAKKGNMKPGSTLDELLLRLDFRDPEPRIIDISPKGGVVATLQESKIECLTWEKDAYLYYFLLRYPGRTLVFLSAIDGIRRLTPLLELLDLKAYALHSQLEQRQRLKNLDRFKANPNAVLLATDIAARGLDIPAVDHVVHYQVPRSADVFIHRSGRTARAMRSGFSLVMCSPEERRVMRMLLGSLGRRDVDIPEMEVERTLLDSVKERVRLAREIDVAQHRLRKARHERHWMKNVAEAMELELDSDVVGDSGDEDGNGGPKGYEAKQTRARIAGMKAELKAKLSRPLIARGVSTRYVTSGSRPIAADMISGKVHSTMLGLARTAAVSDMSRVKEEEEWNGIGW